MLPPVGRNTAYRYFRNQRALLSAVYPEIDAGSMLDADAPSDPVERLELTLDRFTRQIVEHEPELRAQLRLSLDPHPADQSQLPFRKGRAIGWFEEALAPLRESMSPRELRRLALAIRATTGIEALVWLTDIAGLTLEDAAELMRSSARALLRDAIRNNQPGQRRLPKPGVPASTRSKTSRSR